jgi:hypothetical protein
MKIVRNNIISAHVYLIYLNKLIIKNNYENGEFWG